MYTEPKSVIPEINSSPPKPKTENLFPFHPDLLTICLVSSAGYITHGGHGLATGFAASLSDHFLSSAWIENKHYISRGTYFALNMGLTWGSCLSKYAPSYYKPFIYLASITSALSLTYYSDDFLDFSERVSIPIESSELLLKIFDDIKLSQILQNPFSLKLCNNTLLNNYIKLASISLIETASSQLIVFYSGRYVGGLVAKNLLGFYQENGNDNEKLLYEIGKLSLIWSCAETLRYCLDYYKWIINQDIATLISKKAMSILLDEGRVLESSEDALEIKYNLAGDIRTLALNSFVLVDQVTTIFSQLSYLNYVNLYVPDMLAYYPLPFFLIQSPIKNVIQKRTDMVKETHAIRAKANEIYFDIIKNTGPINLRNASDFAQNSYYSNINKQLVSKQFDIKKIDILYSLLNDTVYELSTYLIDFIYFFFKVTGENPISLNQIPLIQHSITNINHIFIAKLSSEFDSQESKISIDRVKGLLFLISKSKEQASNTLKYSDSDDIHFLDYLLKMQGKQLRVDNLVFEKGKHYGIMGSSGCGKSTLLLDLMNLLPANFSSSGSIYLPKDKKILFLDQNLYLPSNLTLIETILFPYTKGDENYQELRSSIEDLINILALDNIPEEDVEPSGILSKLDSTEFKLSGGQRKKVGIIQAIIQKPDILVLDETFAGLDTESIKLTQQLLTHLLADTTILCVDHHARANNYDHFYDAYIDFSSSNTLSTEIIGERIVEDF
ncbi:MAG: ATP-binding cassette domain-containing protein [Rickettsiaceae bacterium]|nr:ATP-binding cassette domain-containing protein [Rickettsiaceae bacterium]